MQTAVLKGLLGPDTLHATIDELKRTKGAPPWSENQPPGHPTDRHYHLVDEWWFIVEGEIDWEIEGQAEPVRARAGDFVFAPGNHFHHIRPKGESPTIRLAITPPGELHRHERAPGTGPYDR